MTKPKILVTRRWPAEVERVLAARFDATLNQTDRAMSVEQLSSAMREYDAILPTVSDRLPVAIFRQNGVRVRFIGNFGVGINHIDLEAASASGIAVSNTPGVLTDCTADLAITLMLMVARRSGEGERQLRSGSWIGWSPTHLIGTKVTGRSLGIVGMGRIGKAVAKRAHYGFGMRVIFYNRSTLHDEEVANMNARQVDSVEEVLQAADFVSLHCPGGAGNRHLINAGRLALMKRNAYLINTARGDVVDENALADAVEQGVIAGAGLDVFENEPQIDTRLLRLENVVLLPHLGSATDETRTAMGMKVIENLDAYFNGAALPDRVA